VKASLRSLVAVEPFPSRIAASRHSLDASPSYRRCQSSARQRSRCGTRSTSKAKERERDGHQRVEVSTRVLRGHPAQVRLEAATGADLLVLGSRGHGTFAGMLLGSVSQHCVQHAPCPVLVVPQHAERSE
jgi:hypothetical protein